MSWRRFVKIDGDGFVTDMIESQSETIEGMMDVTGRDDAVHDADYDADTDTFGRPSPDARRLLKALVLIIKANSDKITIPPAALAIWQDIKDDRL